MSQSNVITCDVCGRQKQETNHWFVAIHDSHDEAMGICFGPHDDEEYSPSSVVEHICGQACAHTRLSQFLDSLTATLNV